MRAAIFVFVVARKRKSSQKTEVRFIFARSRKSKAREEIKKEKGRKSQHKY